MSWINDRSLALLRRAGVTMAWLSAAGAVYNLGVWLWYGRPPLFLFYAGWCAACALLTFWMIVRSDD